MTNPMPDKNEASKEESIINPQEEGDFAPMEGDPEEPGKTETLGIAPNNDEIDKLIGKGLKLPPVEDNGHW